ncbi:HAD-IIIC family phosphatase [Aureimonas endophytica]|nr:HAD-IIIC family phosphatase [Aureimonas endophytica]
MRPLKVLLASAFQPRAIEDALRLGFAIEGFSLVLRPVDGLAALEALLGEAEPPALGDLDLALLPLVAPTAAAMRAASDLAARLAAKSLAPVLLLFVGAEGEAPPLDDPPPGVTVLTVAVPGPATDDRFARTFGLLPSAAAADRLADAAAAEAARLRGMAPKLLVTDLDGTLWAGTLGEDGAGALRLHRPYAAALRRLSDRGIVLAIASRNDPRDLDASFAAHPDWPLGTRDFAATALGWDDKEVLVAEALRRLGLAAEHMVFVDDDAVNCARVASRFPDADIRHFDAASMEDFAAALADDPRLAGAVPSGGHERADHYRRRAAVEALRAETPDVGDFLKRLDSRLTLEPLGPALVPRAAELGARVNQFLLTGFRPNAPDLSRRASPFDFMVRLDDVFGAHGLVGLVLAARDGDRVRLDNLFLSCRALGRGVEDAMLRALGDLARQAGAAAIAVRLDDLPRNEPARRWFSRYGDWARREKDSMLLDTDRLIDPQDLTVRWNRATTF